MKTESNGIRTLPRDDNPEKGILTNDLNANDKNPEDDQKTTCKSCLKTNILTLATCLGVILGIAVGFGLRKYGPYTKRQLMYINFPGEIFLRMLKGLILPLIVSSLVSSVGGLDMKLSGKIGIRAVVYYLATTVIAVILGIILVVSIKPGVGGTDAHLTNKTEAKATTTADTLMDLIRNMFVTNIVEAAIAQFSTELIEPDPPNNNTDFYTWDFKESAIRNTNIMGIVVFSLVLGVTLGHLKERGLPLLVVFISLADAMMCITKLVIWLSPVGVLFLVGSKIMEMEDLSVVAGQVGMYTLTVLVGLFIHGLITLPLIYFIFIRSQPYTFISKMMQAITTAFGTSSSSATLPVTITCLEQKNNIDPRVSRFCLPIGATINMDGTALYEAVAAIFIAQTRQMSLDAGKIIAISITSTAASIGAAGIPQAGLVTMVMVLNVIGLPSEDVAIILVVDWFLDRFRTAINVLGDSIGAAIVAHLSRKDLEKMDRELKQNDSDDRILTEEHMSTTM